MKREIFEVYAKVIDANGAYNTLSGYPKVFDSHQNGDDIEKARSKAYGEYHTVLGTMYNRFDRQQQIAMIIRASDGLQIEKVNLGTVADLPDPQFAVVVNGGSGSGTYTINTPVIISADAPEEGMMFDAWEGAEGLTFVDGDMNSAEATFVMPNNDVTVTATYEAI